MIRHWMVGWILESLLFAGAIIAVEQALDHGLAFQAWTTSWLDFWLTVALAMILLLIAKLLGNALKEHPPA